MATMRELSVQYRLAAARLAMRIQELEAAGDADVWRLRTLKSMLADTRAVQRALSGYYDLPRPEGITAAGWRARGASSDDH